MNEMKPGDFIGGEYRVRQVFGGVGKSGMGVVYLVQARTSEEPFVLKTFQSTNSDEATLTRFKSEAETWVNIGNHPNVVRCHWVSEFKKQLFVAAEYVWPDKAGRNTLTQYLETGGVSLRQQLQWIAHFCFGMKHAISHGLKAHRDIKPDNLMVDNHGRLKITDFGLAKGFPHGEPQIAIAGKHFGVDNLTGVGMAVGTPPFMSPEQFFDSSAVDHRADIYSLGVVIYLMIAGRHPISPAVNSDWANAHMCQRVAQIDHPLMPLAGICLEKERNRRFQSYDDILKIIGETCREHGIPVPQDGKASRAVFDREWSVAMSLINLNRPEEAIAGLNRMAAEWPDSSEVYNELCCAYLKLGKLDEAKKAVERSLALDEYSTARWNNLGAILAQIGRSEEARSAYAKSLKIEPENTGAMIGLAQLLMQQGELKDAKVLCELAVFWRPEKLNVWKIASECFLRCQDAVRAKPLLQKLVSQEPQDATAWFNLALCCESLGETEAYVYALREATKLNPKDGQALNLLIQGLADSDQTEEAIATCGKLAELEDWKIVAVCKHAQLLAVQGKGMAAYLLLNQATSMHERSAALWFTMAVVLSQAPAQYRRQAHIAAQNALLCYEENPKQLTSENYRVLKDLAIELNH